MCFMEEVTFPFFLSTARTFEDSFHKLVSLPMIKISQHNIIDKSIIFRKYKIILN